ncbi:MAG TPA: methyltransferase domain-containing protein [Burkholderiales bacterium]
MPASETYQLGHHPSVVARHARRTAETAAAFFLPFLKPGMRLLDAGCGPGSITSGFAQRVAPGETIGIDPSAEVIATAKSLARATTARNLSYEVGSIYEPRFAAGTFDAVFTHQVLQHLRHPVDALRQLLALLVPGGVLGVRVVDWGSAIFYPESDRMRRCFAVQFDLARRNGGEPNAGRHLRRWLREAGFGEMRITTSTESDADADATRDRAEMFAERVLRSSLADSALECGLATRSDLEGIAAAWRAWGRDPDAFFCFSHTEVVAWKR